MVHVCQCWQHMTDFLICIFFLCLCAGAQRVEAFGSEGMVQADNRFHNQCMVSNSSAVQRDLPMNFFMDRYKDAYRTEMRAFVEAIKNNTPPPCGVAEGRAAARIAAAAKKSVL